MTPSQARQVLENHFDTALKFWLNAVEQDNAHAAEIHFSIAVRTARALNIIPRRTS
jgi:hypothetical protein